MTPPGKSISDAIVFHQCLQNSPQSSITMRNINIKAQTTFNSILMWHYGQVDLDGIYVNGGPVNAGVSRITVWQGTTVNPNGTVNIRNVEFANTQQGGIEITRWPPSVCDVDLFVDVVLSVFQ